MSAQILCSSASPIDVLQLSSELNKRVQSILSRAIDKLPAARTIDPIEARTEIAKALEPFLGGRRLSAAWCPIAVAREGSQEGSGSMKSYKTRSGSHSMPTMLSKFQTMIDLSGAFGSIFARVEEPLKQLSIDLSQLGERVQEAQRDLTMRRCAGVETRLGLHSAVLNDLQPELQQMWQEQLDRVRRQQIIYREKVEECFSMRETARHVLTAAKQLVPYAACIESMSALIDPKRCHPPDPAPMESICMQITGIEPNSESRIQAIEKEEQNRRAVQEAKKREELAERGTPVKGLKHAKANRKDTNRLLVNTNRERSPGGTDSTLISPCLLKRISPSVREETTSDLEMESAVWRENFELTGEEKLETAGLAIQEEERCSSSLSLTAQSSSQPAALPSLEQLLGRSPLASRVTVDIGVSHQSMLQSLHDVFASQRPEGEAPVCEEPSMLASAVKIAQKMHQLPVPAVRTEPKTVEEPSDSAKKTRKERRRRKKRSGDAAENREDAVVESTVAVAEAMPVPDVPYVPSRVFDASDMPLAKLGSFEAKEKMLRSLREKMARSDDSS
ncbi:hypothetical protein ANCDUO_09376 [Ancylostoma duodenale]|uniref:Uncharacterized protein n=1 Tax=Ancylostoma duodenale TaxID=51022 RepID=A0A0C2GMZ6_9BILA|nr:hypothetical protein ANCDUO_09376 [Ancylostoma duodenale]